MRRFLFAVVLLVSGSSVASAESLPWSFYVRFQAADGKQTILLGSETVDNGPSLPPTPEYITYTTGGFGPSRINYQTDLGTQSMFDFGHGFWAVTEAPPLPATTSTNAFDLFWGFQSQTEMANGIDRGYISVAGIHTSGTGNTLIDLDVSHDITLDGRRAKVRFHASNNESVSRIEMTVTELTPAPTPEPATMLLAGLGLAGVGVWRRLKK